MSATTCPEGYVNKHNLVKACMPTIDTYLFYNVIDNIKDYHLASISW